MGKTAAAIQLATHFQTEIISADSRQCYKELAIGVARPSVEELQAVPHHFIASHSIHEEITAAGFEQYALQKAAELFREKDVVVMTGGTGLYLKAFTEGLHNIPAIDPAIREQIIAQYEKEGIGWLQQQLKEKDPLFAAEGEMQNPQRMMRALEVWEGTGRSVLSYRQGEKSGREFSIVKTALMLPREELNRNIETRVQRMLEAGLVEEARSLLSFRHLNALQTVGYAELFDYFDGHSSLSEAKESIIIHTRQYAKRQMTWFSRDKEINWFSPADTDSLIGYISTYISQNL